MLKDLHGLAGVDWDRMSSEMRRRLRSEGLRMLRQAFTGEALTAVEVCQREAADLELGLKLSRKANRDYIEQVDYMLQEICGKGLMAFLPPRRWLPLAAGEKRYRESTRMEEGVEVRRCARKLVGGERLYEVPKAYFSDGTPKVDILHVTIDQGQHGLAAWLWCLMGKGVRMSLTCDLFHRIHNDLLAATSAAGLAGVRLDATHVLKYKEGPFKSESNASVLREAARDLHQSAPATNPLWDMLFSAVASEKGINKHCADFGSETHMQAVWDEVLLACSHKATGEHTRPSRWFAFERASRRCVASRHQDLLLLLWLGCRRGWWKSMAENPLMCLWRPEPDAQADDAVAVAEDVEAVEGADHEVADVGVAETNMSKAKKTADQKRQSIKSGLQYCLHLLLQEHRCHLWKGMVYLTLPLEEFMRDTHTAIKTLRGTFEWASLRSKGGLDEAVKSLLSHWFSDQFQALLKEGNTTDMAMRACPWSSEEVTTGRFQLWSFLVQLCSEIAMTGLTFKNPPFCMLSLVSPHNAVVYESLAMHALQWKAYTALEKTALEDHEASSWLEAAHVPRQQWPMQNFISLHEVDFKRVPKELKKMLEEYGRSWMSSLVVEHLWNAARRGAVHTGSGRMGHDMLYHHISLASDTLGEFGRKNCSVTPAARTRAPDRLAADCYTRQPAHCSISEEDERHMQSNNPDWPTASGSSLKKAAVHWQALVCCQGNWDRLQHAWKSLLARPGWLLNRKGSGQLLLCLGSSSAGVLTLRVGCRTGTRELYFLAAAKVEIVVITDVAEWHAAEAEVKQYTSETGGELVGPVVGRKGSDLIKWAAYSGFSGLTMHWLKKLSTDLEIPAAQLPRPPVADGYVTTLVKTVLGEAATESVLKDALLRRNGVLKKQENMSVDPCVPEFEDENAEGELNGECEEEDEQLVDLHWERRVQAAQEQRKQEVRRNIEASFAIPVSVPDNTRDTKPRRFVPAVAGGISAEQAKQYLPRGARISKDTVRENRWRMFSPRVGMERTKAFGKRSLLDDWGAMTHLLLLAWQAEFKATGEACPWDFQELRPRPGPGQQPASGSGTQ